MKRYMDAAPHKTRYDETAEGGIMLSAEGGYPTHKQLTSSRILRRTFDWRFAFLRFAGDIGETYRPHG